MRGRWAYLLLVIACTGCGMDNELAARYHLEREYYQARKAELDAYATYPADDFAAWRVAAGAYTTVLLSNPARIPESRSWSREVVSDMERVSLSAEIGLLRLEAVDFRFHDAVTHGGYTNESVNPEPLGAVRLEHVSAMYDSLGVDPVTQRCAQRARAIIANPILWQGTVLLRDSLLSVPGMIAGRRTDALRAAEAFYSRIITTWPDSSVAARARDYRARVRIARRAYADALDDLDASARTHPESRRRDQLRLLRADVLAFRLDRSDEAAAVLRGIIASDPAADAAWWARVRLALIQSSPEAEREEWLQRIHMDPRAPDNVAAAAMYARALVLEARGDRTGAAELFWRLAARHPDSRPALAAPLHLIREYLARGERTEASEVLRRADGYYRDVIARESAAVSPRYLGMDCLLEAFLLLDRPQDAAGALQTASQGCRADSRVVAGLKVALLNHFRTGNLENSVEILEKTLVEFPQSRYSRAIRWRLQRCREARDERSG